MLVTITALTPTGGTPAQAFTLADDSQQPAAGLTSWPNGAPGLCEKGFLPDLAAATQRDELINSEYCQDIPRGNKQYTLTFSVSRTFDTLDNCLLFLRDHAALVPEVGTLLVKVNDGDPGTYLRNAVQKSVRCTEHSGSFCIVSYTYASSYVPPVYGAPGTGTGGAFSISPTT